MAHELEKLLGKDGVPIVGLRIHRSVMRQEMHLIAGVHRDLQRIGHGREDVRQIGRQALGYRHLLGEVAHADAVGGDEKYGS